MADVVELKEGEIVVSQKTLTEVLERVGTAEKLAADATAKAAGIEAILEAGKDAGTTGEGKLRERKNFEPAFRTVTLKKYPIAGNVEDKGYVIGWDNRGAYQQVDRSGVAPVVIDYINIFFFGKERNKEGKLTAEAVPLLSLLNAEEVTCKILEIKKGPVDKRPTGEEINITVWDPKHGLVETGETIDGWVGFTPISYVIQIPGVAEPVEVDEKYLNN